MNPKTKMRPSKQALPCQTSVCRVDGEVTLTPRQRQIQALVAKNLSNAEIAAKLGIQKATVRRQLANIHQRTGQALRPVGAAGSVTGGADPYVVAVTVDAGMAQGLEPEMACTGGADAGPRQSMAGNTGPNTGKTGSAKKVPSSQTPAKRLSPREDQVLKLAAQGKIDKTIADELKISRHTVNTYWRRIFIKTGMHDRKKLLAEMARESIT